MSTPLIKKSASTAVAQRWTNKSAAAALAEHATTSAITYIHLCTY